LTSEIDEATQEEVAEVSEEDERGLAPVEGSDPGTAPDDRDEHAHPDADRTEVEQLRAEVDGLTAQLLRKRAEFDNFRKRTERERADLRDLSVAQVLLALLPTVDNLERAATATGDEASVREGLDLIMKGLRSFLDQHRLVANDPVGQQFDPERHQALTHEEVEGYSEGQIVEVFQKGYSVGDRLIRAALVRVAKGPEGNTGSESADEAESE